MEPADPILSSQDFVFDLSIFVIPEDDDDDDDVSPMAAECTAKSSSATIARPSSPRLVERLQELLSALKRP